MPTGIKAFLAGSMLVGVSCTDLGRSVSPTPVGEYPARALERQLPLPGVLAFLRDNQTGGGPSHASRADLLSQLRSDLRDNAREGRASFDETADECAVGEDCYGGNIPEMPAAPPGFAAQIDRNETETYVFVQLGQVGETGMAGSLSTTIGENTAGLYLTRVRFKGTDLKITTNLTVIQSNGTEFPASPSPTHFKGYDALNDARTCGGCLVYFKALAWYVAVDRHPISLSLASCGSYITASSRLEVKFEYPPISIPIPGGKLTPAVWGTDAHDVQFPNGAVAAQGNCSPPPPPIERRPPPPTSPPSSGGSNENPDSGIEGEWIEECTVRYESMSLNLRGGFTTAGPAIAYFDPDWIIIRYPVNDCAWAWEEHSAIAVNRVGSREGLDSANVSRRGSGPAKQRAFVIGVGPRAGRPSVTLESRGNQLYPILVIDTTRATATDVEQALVALRTFGQRTATATDFSESVESLPLPERRDPRMRTLATSILEDLGSAPRYQTLTGNLVPTLDIAVPLGHRREKH